MSSAIDERFAKVPRENKKATREKSAIKVRKDMYTEWQKKSMDRDTTHDSTPDDLFAIRNRPSRRPNQGHPSRSSTPDNDPRLQSAPASTGPEKQDKADEQVASVFLDKLDAFTPASNSGLAEYATVDPVLAESHGISIENASSAIADDKDVEWTSLDTHSLVLVLIRYHVSLFNQSINQSEAVQTPFKQSLDVSDPLQLLFY
jgi:hypothetical protein